MYLPSKSQVRPFYWALLLAVALLAITSSSLRAQQSSMPPVDSSGALALVSQYVTAWNLHDAAAVAGLFAEDADFINPVGHWSSSRAAIQAEHESVLSGFLKGSKITADTTAIRFIGPEVAVTHVQCTISGGNNPDGTARKPFHVLTTFLANRDHDQWRIQSGQVTFVGPGPVMPANMTGGMTK